MPSTWYAVSDLRSASFCSLARVFSYGVHGPLVFRGRRALRNVTAFLSHSKAPHLLWKFITFTSLWTSHISKQAKCICAQHFFKLWYEWFGEVPQSVLKSNTRINILKHWIWFILLFIFALHLSDLNIESTNVCIDVLSFFKASCILSLCRPTNALNKIQ